MKTSFQICNVPHPNSCKNSCIFSIYEAADTTTNLKKAMELAQGMEAAEKDSKETKAILLVTSRRSTMYIAREQRT